MTWRVNDTGEEDYLDGIICQYAIEDQDGRPVGWIFDEADAHKASAAADLYYALEELHAMVWGECPSLFNEDSGGTPRTDINIQRALAKYRGESE